MRAWDEERCTNYEGRCGNCHSYMDEEDKYCKVCGTKKGEGAFAPYSNMMECIYGPAPQKRIHKCKNCGHTWETFYMIDNEKYCPKCGKTCSMEECDEELWF